MPPKAPTTTPLAVVTTLRLGTNTSIANIDFQVVIRGQL